MDDNGWIASSNIEGKIGANQSIVLTTVLMRLWDTVKVMTLRWKSNRDGRNSDKFQ